MCDSFSKYLWVSSNVAHCCRSYQSMPIFTALHQEISLEYLDGTGFILSSIDNICLVTTSCCNFNVYQFLLVWLHQSPRLVRGLFALQSKSPLRKSRNGPHILAAFTPGDFHHHLHLLLTTKHPVNFCILAGLPTQSYIFSLFCPELQIAR